MKFKLQPPIGQSLCHSCRDGFVVEFTNGRQHIRCRSQGNDHPVRLPVARCTEYDNRNHTSRWDMEKVAWTLRTDKSGLKIGFVPPKKEEDD